MQPSIDIIAVLTSAGVAQSAFWALALLNSPNSRLAANRILAALLVAFALGLTVSIFYQTRFILVYSHFSEMGTPLKFIYPPLFYLYVRALTCKRFRLTRNLLHFVPALICAIYLMPFFLSDSASKKDYIVSSFAHPPNTDYVISSLVLVQEVIYVVLLLRLLRQHSRQVKQSFSTVEKINLAWIRNLLIAMVGVTVLYVYFEFQEFGTNADYLVGLSLTVFIFLVGYLGLRQPQVFTTPENSRAAPKYQKSGLTPEKAKEFLDELTHLMTTEKPYLNDDLTLQELATRLAISPNHLSQLLNEHVNQTFFDFVNAYRVEEARRLLQDAESEHLTVLAIAYDAGFTSKSSFNAAFKKFTGLTPSQFKKTVPPQV